MCEELHSTTYSSDIVVIDSSDDPQQAIANSVNDNRTSEHVITMKSM